MPDQPHRPYRGQDVHGHQDQRSSGGGDPLAELARLIGSQNDPFAAQPRGASRSGPVDWRPAADSYPREPHAANGYDQHPRHAQPEAYYGDQSDPRYGAPPFAAGQGYAADPYYRDDEHDGYEEESPARRRGGILTLFAVLVLALLGTAAAFGYRAVFGNNSSSPPPVIKADTTPNKIVPATTSGEQSKLIYDRVGDKSQPERLVPREEKPVDVGDNLKPSPRVVTATGTTPSSPMAAPSAPQLPPGASALVSPAAPASTTPKRVRTVTIKPDGPDAEAPVTPKPTASRTATVQASAAPAAETVVPPPARTVSTRAPTPQAPNPNAPLSLSPNANSAPALAPARTQTMRTASAPVAAPAPAAASGGYTVQVSSQRSEADAQAAFRSLQGKYPGVLGGYQPMIRRADLGEKGVYYRVQVGPFASDQATDLCSRLQSAGGQCVVQRN